MSNPSREPVRTPLPSKHMVLSACAGAIAPDHPVLRAAAELAGLYRAGKQPEVDTIEHERARLMRRIDEWVTAVSPPALDAAFLHSETVGMIIDRLARLSVATEAADHGRVVSDPGAAVDRLTELADAFGDLSFEISRGTRRLPTFSL